MSIGKDFNKYYKDLARCILELLSNNKRNEKVDEIIDRIDHLQWAIANLTRIVAERRELYLD